MNKISDPTQKREIRKLIWNFFTWFNVLLFVEAVLSFLNMAIVGDIYKVELVYGVFFLFLVLANFVTVCYQEERMRKRERFRGILQEKCSVIREGKVFIVDSEELVPGDLVIIKAGCKIPADLRIITVRDIKIQQSDINGEADCIEASVKRVENIELDSQHIIYAGSKCLEGSGKGVVLHTGDQTLLGKIAQSSTFEGVKTKKGTIQTQLSKIVLLVVLLDVFTMIVASLANIRDWSMTFSDYVSISFGNIPQALAITTTLCLTIVARRLQNRDIVVKRLDCLESLSAGSVVLCDKTGTLTMNRMTVMNVWFNTSIRTDKQIRETLEHDSRESQREKFLLKGDKGWRLLFKAACLCNKAGEREDGELEGGAEDQALYRFCGEMEGKTSIHHYKAKYENIVFEIPFKSAQKYQVSVRSYSRGKRCLLMKGAPETVIQHCSTYLRSGQILEMDQRFHERFEKAQDTFGKQGERMLGVAYTRFLEADLPPNNDYPVHNLTFVGMFSFQDPAKPGVADAIKIMKEANLSVYMLTGDHVETAQCLAKHLGMLHTLSDNFDEDNNFSAMITGKNLRGLNKAQWANLLKKQEIVFARVSPEDKEYIVKKFREEGGKTVVMIGDGANDTIALKEADVGIVMGENCSVLSQDVADIMITDGEFSQVVHCIEQSRLFFDNLKKAVAYTLAHCILEVFPCFLSAAADFPKALSNIQMLMIDIGTEILPAISLAFLKSNEKIMENNPRNPKKDTLISWKLILHSYVIMGSIELFWCLLSYFLTFRFTNVSEACRVDISDFSKIMGADLFNDDGKNSTYNSYCSSDQQNQVLAQVQMAWFTTAVLGQFSNILLMVGVRQVWTWVAVGIELIIWVFVIAVPRVNKRFFLKEEGVDIIYNEYFLFIPWIGTFLCLMSYYWGKRRCLRRNPGGGVTRFFNW